MTRFTNEEQLDNDFNLYLSDKHGKLALICHVGWRLLPPSIAKDKESYEIVDRYLEELPVLLPEYGVCAYLASHLDFKTIGSYEKYVGYFGQFSSKGLYTFDSYDFSRASRPYYRVTIPKQELTLESLPNEVKDILSLWRLTEVDFSDDSLIAEDLLSGL